MSDSSALLDALAWALRVGGAALSILFVGRMLFTFRRVHAVSRRACVQGVVFPVLMLAAYAFFLGSALPPAVLSALLALGLAGGAWQGRKTRVWVAAGRPQAQNTLWFLAIWVISFAVTQGLVALGTAQHIDIGVGAMCATTGIAIGAQSIILLRLARSLSTATAPADAPAARLR